MSTNQNDIWIKKYSTDFYKKSKNCDRHHWFSEKLTDVLYSLIFNFYNIKEGTRVLDIGCGCGDFFEYIFNRFDIDFNFFSEIKGNDVVDEFLETANNNKLLTGVKFEKLNILSDNINDKYDFISIIGVFQLFEGNYVINILERLLDILNNNGVLYISALNNNINDDNFSYINANYTKNCSVHLTCYNKDYLINLINSFGNFDINIYGINKMYNIIPETEIHKSKYLFLIIKKTNKNIKIF